MEARATADLAQYLSSYAAQDLAGVARHLDADVEVWAGGALVARGREAILPSYTADWARGRRVTVMRAA